MNLGSTPGRASIATLAQLVERNLAKVEVTSSNLVCRSRLYQYGESGAEIKKLVCPGGEIGRHKGFKIPRLSSRAGSSPARGTIYKEQRDNVTCLMRH